MGGKNGKNRKSANKINNSNADPKNPKKQFKQDIKAILKALEKAIDEPSEDSKGSEDDQAAEEELLNSLMDFTVDPEQGIKVKHLLIPDSYEGPEQQPPEEQIHSDGIFDCYSPYWEAVFTMLPSVDPLEATYMDTEENFLFTGMYLFCQDVLSDNYGFFNYYYDPGVAYRESTRCATQKDVIELQQTLKAQTEEYMFWINFNDWLAGILDTYPTSEFPGDLQTYDEVTNDEELELDEAELAAALDQLYGVMP